MSRPRAAALGLLAVLLGARAGAHEEKAARAVHAGPAPVARPRPPPGPQPPPRTAPGAAAPSAPATRAPRFLGPPTPAPALVRPDGAATRPLPDQAAVRAGQALLPARVPVEPGAGEPILPPAPFRLADPVPPPAPPQHPLAPPAGSAEARSRVRITVRAIAARKAGEALEIDGRLRPIDRDLRSFAEQFNYKIYQLLDEQTLELDFRGPAQMELPGQRALELQPTGLLGDGRLRLHLELLGPHPWHERKMHTDYSLPRGRTILVGGYRVDPGRPESGTLLLAITQVE